MTTQKYTTTAEVARAIGADAYGLKLLKFLNEYFPQDALDYDLIMGQAKEAAAAAEEYVLEHGTDPVHQIEAENHAYEVLLGAYAHAYSKYDDLFRIFDDILYDAGLRLEAAQVQEVVLPLMPKFEPIYAKYPIEESDFTASVEYDTLKEELRKLAEKLLSKSEIEKIKKVIEQKELDELPF